MYQSENIERNVDFSWEQEHIQLITGMDLTSDISFRILSVFPKFQWYLR